MHLSRTAAQPPAVLPPQRAAAHRLPHLPRPQRRPRPRSTTRAWNWQPGPWPAISAGSQQPTALKFRPYHSWFSTSGASQAIVTSNPYETRPEPGYLLQRWDLATGQMTAECTLEKNSEVVVRCADCSSFLSAFSRRALRPRSSPVVAMVRIDSQDGERVPALSIQDEARDTDCVLPAGFQLVRVHQRIQR